MEDHTKAFFQIHGILDTFEMIVLETLPSYRPEMIAFYKYKLKFYRTKFNKKKSEKIIKKRNLMADRTKVALWMSMALDEIFQVVLDQCRRREITQFHNKLYSLANRYGLGRFPRLEDNSDESESDTEDEGLTVESQLAKIKSKLN